MNEYATEIRIRFYDDNELNIQDLFNSLQCLKAKDYLELYQLMYQDLVEHQHLKYDVLVSDKNAKKEGEE